MTQHKTHPKCTPQLIGKHCFKQDKKDELFFIYRVLIKLLIDFSKLLIVLDIR